MAAMTMTAATTNPTYPNWAMFAGSSIGKAHIDSGMPNQDNLFYHQTANASIAVVCDGAGSARFSEVGARFFSQAVGTLLQKLSEPTSKTLMVADWQHAIVQGLIDIRQQLANQLTGDATLRDYHSTLTAMAILHVTNQAILVQVGDSPLLTSQFVVDGQQIDYFNPIAIYGDDNKNEYVNETHFITQDNWQDFVRIAWLDVSQLDLIALMSDGCADLVFEGASVTPKIYRPFFGNLVFNLCQSQTNEQGNAIIEQAISNPATYRLTGDDKTLIMLIKQPHKYQTFEPIIADTDGAATATNAATPASVWHAPNHASNSDANNDQINTPSISPHATAQASVQAISHPPLPPSAPLKSTSKERRNVALIAGSVVAIAAGTLGWMNKDKLLTAKDNVPSSSQVIASQPTNQPSTEQLPSLASPATAFALDFPVAIFQVGEKFATQVLLGVPKTAITQYPLVSNASNPQNFTIAKVINPNTPAFKETLDFNNRYPASVQQNHIVGNWEINYQYHCQIVDENTTDYQKLNIVLDKNYQYRLCRINFSEMQKKDFQPKFDATVTQLVFDKGFAPLLDSEFNLTKTLASTPKANVSNVNNQSKAIIHYLPNDFNKSS